MPLPHFLRRSKSADDITPDIRLWILRLLVPLGAHSTFISDFGFSNESVAKALGLDAWIDPSGVEFTPQAVRKELRKLHQAGERELRSAAKPASCLAGNVARLSALVGLSEVDCRILKFAVLSSSHRTRSKAGSGSRGIARQGSFTMAAYSRITDFGYLVGPNNSVLRRDSRDMQLVQH